MSGPTRRVLLADDHEIVRSGLRRLLETRGNLFVVAEAASGREALAEARSHRPDIAIIEYALPELNGLDLAIALHREVPGTRVLMHTTNDREDLVVAAFEAGVSGYVLKSMSEEHMLAAIDALSVGRKYFDQILLDQSLRHRSEQMGAAGSTLTHREREVVQLVAEGKLNKQIGGILEISPKTVETHRAASMRKLNLRTTADLVRYALRNGIAKA